MCNDTPFSCKRGGILEYNLFAKVYKVNVAIHQDTNEMKRDGAYMLMMLSLLYICCFMMSTTNCFDTIGLGHNLRC